MKKTYILFLILLLTAASVFAQVDGERPAREFLRDDFFPALNHWSDVSVSDKDPNKINTLAAERAFMEKLVVPKVRNSQINDELTRANTNKTGWYMFFKDRTSYGMPFHCDFQSAELKRHNGKELWFYVTYSVDYVDKTDWSDISSYSPYSTLFVKRRVTVHDYMLVEASKDYIVVMEVADHLPNAAPSGNNNSTQPVVVNNPPAQQATQPANGNNNPPASASQNTLAIPVCDGDKLGDLFKQLFRARNNPSEKSKLEAELAIARRTGPFIYFNMIKVEGGVFQMGGNDSEAFDTEKPVHSVTLSDYYIAETEVTQKLWKQVMGRNPDGMADFDSIFFGNDLPVVGVSWNDIRWFINRLNQLTGKEFRLPTDAEWEFAARGGNKSNGYKYSGGNNIGDVAWYGSNSDGKTHPVKGKLPNELGIYDMSGNVWEWCQDWYGDFGYRSQKNPQGPSQGNTRVNRGGGWDYYSRNCRVSRREGDDPNYRHTNLGFRLAL